MGQRIDLYGDTVEKYWGTGTWTDIYYHGYGSISGGSSIYQSESVKLFTDNYVRSINFAVTGWGVGVWASSAYSSINVWGLSWLDINVGGGGNQNLTLGSPGKVLVSTGNGNDNVNVYEGGSYTRIDIGDGWDLISLGSGIESHVSKANGYLKVDGAGTYRAGLTEIVSGWLWQGGDISSSAYRNWVVTGTTGSTINLSLYGLELNHYEGGSGNGNHNIWASSPGKNEFWLGDGNDNVSIDQGGSYTFINLKNGTDTVTLGSGINTDLYKGDGYFRVNGSNTYRSGTTNITSGWLSWGADISSSSYKNWIVTGGANGSINLSLYGLAVNHYEGGSNSTAKHNIWASSPGKNELWLGNGDDTVAIDQGGSYTFVDLKDGRNRISVGSGINADIYQGSGAFDYIQGAYLSGTLQIFSGTAQTRSESRSYGLTLSVREPSGYGHSGTWHGYALGWADVILETGRNFFSADVFAGSRDTASVSGNNFLRISALLDSTIKDNGGNNYYVTGVQHGSVAIWTDLQRKNFGFTAVEHLGQKLDLKNESGAGTQVLMNSGGVIGSLSFARSGNGLVNNVTGANLTSDVYLGANYNFLINQKDQQTRFSFSGNGNIVIDGVGSSAPSYTFTTGSNNMAILGKGYIDASATSGFMATAIAGLTSSSSRVKLGAESTLTFDAQLGFPIGAKLTLYRFTDAKGDWHFDLYASFNAQNQNRNIKLSSVTVTGQLPSKIVVDLGQDGALFINEPGQSLTRPLLSHKGNSIFEYLLNQSGPEVSMLKGPTSAAQDGLLMMMDSRSVLSLPGLTQSVGLWNGNFSRGLSDFQSDYSRTDDPSSYRGPGSITLTTNAPNGWGFGSSTGPQGVGTSFLVVDGGPDASKAFWANPVTGVRAGSTYTFSFDMMAGSGTSPVLQLYVDGIATGPQITVSSGQSWTRKTVTFTVPSSNNGNVYLELKTLTTASAYNDFGFANVALAPVLFDAPSITNGNFVNGFNGFTSGYQKTGGGPGSIQVADELPSSWGFATTKGPNGYGKFLLVDGGSNPDTPFWKQTVSGLQGGAEYTVRLKMVGSSSSAVVVLDVDGSQQPTLMTTESTKGWKSYAVTFRVPEGRNSVSLALRDLTTGAIGNDFGVTGLSIAPVISPTFNDVPNGDFAQGNTGFMSDYRFSEGGWGSGVYQIVTQTPDGWGMGAKYGPNGSGKFLLADGGDNPNAYVWKGQVSPLTGGAIYIFRFKMLGSDTNSARLVLDVNGVEQTNGGIWKAKQADGWIDYSVMVKVPAGNGPLTLGLRNLTKGMAGNDFAIDEIHFTPVAATPTSQGISERWLRDVRVVYAQNSDEVGDVSSLSPWQQYLLANNSYGLNTLKTLDATTIARLGPDFFAYASPDVYKAWADQGGKLGAVSAGQITAVSYTTAMEMLRLGVAGQLNSDARQTLFEKVAMGLATLDWSKETGVQWSVVPKEVFAAIPEEALTRLKASTIYTGTLTTEQKKSVDDGLAIYAQQHKAQDHMTGILSAAAAFAGLSQADLSSINNGLDDSGVTNLLDLKVPGWGRWPYSFPYFTVTWTRNWYAGYIQDLKTSMPGSGWRTGFESMATTIGAMSDSPAKSNLQQHLQDLQTAFGNVQTLAANMGSANSVLQDLRFYASLYRTFAAISQFGADLDNSALSVEDRGLLALRLVTNVFNGLQVPNGYIAQSLTNHVGTDGRGWSTFTEWANYWKSKAIGTAASAAFDLRQKEVSWVNARSTLGKYESAIKQLRVEAAAQTWAGNTNGRIEEVIEDVLYSTAPASAGVKPTSAEVFRASAQSLTSFMANTASTVLAVWQLSVAARALANNMNLTDEQKAAQGLVITQNLVSTAQGVSYWLADNAGWWGDLANARLVPKWSAGAKVQATGYQVAAVLGIVASAIDIIVQGLSINKNNVIAPVVGMIQSSIFLVLSAVSMAVPAAAPFVLAFELLFPNFQSAVIAATMADRLSLIDAVGEITGTYPAAHRDDNMEQGYLASASPWKAIYITLKGQYDQMATASSPLGSVSGPIAMAAATTTLKNLIHYEPDFSDGPGHHSNAEANYIKTVLAEQALFNFLVSNVSYLSGGSGLIDWGQFGQVEGGRDSIESKVAMLQRLYQEGFQFVFTVASGQSVTYANGNGISSANYAVLTDLGPYTGLVKVTAPTHMYHQAWDLNTGFPIDLFLAASRMHDIDVNLNPYTIGAISFGLAGQSVYLNTREGSSVNLYFLADQGNTAGKDEHLYLGAGNFGIRVLESDAQKHMIIHAGTDSGTFEGAREMYGSTQGSSNFLASVNTTKVEGGNRWVDTLGISPSIDLTTVKYTDSKVIYDYLSAGVTKNGEVSYTKINNFSINNDTDLITVAFGSTHQIALSVTETTKRLSVESGKAPTVILSYGADDSRVELRTTTAEVAANTQGNDLVVFDNANTNNKDYYTLSAIAGNDLDGYDAKASTYFDYRSYAPLDGSAVPADAWSALGSATNLNTFSMGLQDLLDAAKPAQMFISGAASVNGTDSVTDVLQFSNVVKMGAVLTNFSMDQLQFNWVVGRPSLTTVGDHRFMTKATYLAVSVESKEIAQVYNISAGAANLDIYLDGTFLRQVVI